MKIIVRGYAPITIPAALERQEQGAFGADTPYVDKLVTRFRQKSYREKKLPSKLLALEELKRRAVALGGYKSFSEPLAGVGLSARIFDVGGPVYLNDTDEACRKILSANFKAIPTANDVLTAQLPTADLTFLDFNDFTLKRGLTGPYGEALTKALTASRKFLVLNNCSVFYLRYGESSFAAYSKYVERKVTTVEEYFAAEAALFRKLYPEWYVVHVAYFRDTSFQLFSRKRAKLKLEKIEPKPIVTFVETSGLLR